MTQVAIIVPVLEEHDATPYGMYVRHVTMQRVPVSGEWLDVATKTSAVQNVIWYIGENAAERVEVFLPPRPLGPGHPETINELFDNGFVPMLRDGSELTWEEDAERRASPAAAQAAEGAPSEEPEVQTHG